MKNYIAIQFTQKQFSIGGKAMPRKFENNDKSRVPVLFGDGEHYYVHVFFYTVPNKMSNYLLTWDY